MTTLSLRSRLALASATVIVAVAVVLGWRLREDAHAEVDRLFDAQMMQSARLLLAQAEDIDELEDQGKAMRRAGDRRRSGDDLAMAFRVLDDKGAELFRSASTFRPPAVPFATTGFADVEIDGQIWRLVRLLDDDRELKVELGQPHDRRVALAARLAGRLTLPMLVALPLLLLLVWWAAGRGLRPLGAIARGLDARRADQLDPLAEDVPREVRPLVRALNELFRRVDGAWRRERRFTADAAHELRTPLAGLRANAQLAAGSGDDDERRQALDRLIAGVDRAAHLVDELLSLARVDAATALPVDGSIDLAELAAEVIEEIQPLLAAGGINVAFAEPPAGHPTVRGDEALLHVALRNLVDNAVRHAGAGGALELRLDVDAGHVALSVLDRGPGIPEALVGRAGERFFRVPGTSASGAGLGLSLVRRIAELHGGTLAIANRREGTGLQATLRLPLSGA